MEPFEVLEVNDGLELKVVCIGVGGAGCNVIAHMFNKALERTDLIAIDTDAESLAQINRVKKIQIGSKLVKDLGAGMKPRIDQECALESYAEIKRTLDGADMVLISAGLGGGAGTGASPIIAQIAKEVGALTISIVTMPFKFEGEERFHTAESGLENIKKESDSVVVIENEKFISSIDRELGLKGAFKIVDAAVEEVINGIIDMVLLNGENDINLDFVDLQTVMSYKGIALIGFGEHKGENSAIKAINQSIKDALPDDISLNQVRGVLIYFHIHSDFPMMEIAEAMEIIHGGVHDDAEIIIGMTTNESVNEEYIKVTMILTGFEKNIVANNVDDKI